MKRISRLALGRRSRWIVIATWVVLAIGLGWLQPKLQARAADESETFRARGSESTQVHQKRSSPCNGNRGRHLLAEPVDTREIELA